MSLPLRRRTSARPDRSHRRGLLRIVAAAGALILLSACSVGPPIEGAQPSELLDVEELPAATSSPSRTTSPSASSTTPPAAGPWIVSLGDSFISGEAGRWAGNSYVSSNSDVIDALGPTAYFDAPDGKSELIPLCHRSKSAMVHIGDGGNSSNPVGSTNLACSGAETRTMTEDGAFKPGLDFVGDGTPQQGQASMLRDLARQQDVQMVLVSIGGNDFGFADVIADCAEAFVEDGGYCSQDPTITKRISPGAVGKITGRITTALQNVRQAMRQAGRKDGTWTLVVNLNPDTLPLAGDFRYPETESRFYDGGCGVYDTDAQWAGTTFVGAVRSAAAAAMTASGVSPAVLLDLSSLLDARELCATGVLRVGETRGAKNWQAAGAVDASEWANEIRKDDSGPYFEQESLHPDYWGQLAARSCVRQLYASQPRVNSSCSRTGTGLSSRGEPVVTLQASGGS